MNQEIFLYCISQECQIEKKLCDNLESVYLHSKDNHKLVKFADLNQIIDNEYAIIPRIKNQINETNQQVQHIRQLIDQTSAEIQQRYLQAIKDLDKENQSHIKINGANLSQVQQNQIIQNIERDILQKGLQTQTQKLFQNFKESILSFKKEILEELNIQLRKLVEQKANQVQFQETPTKIVDDSVQQQQNQQTPIHFLQDGPQIVQNINVIQQSDAQVQQRALEQEKVQLTRKIFIFNQTLSDNHMKKSDKMITAKDQSLAFIHEDFNLSKRETYALKLQLRELDTKVQTQQLIRVGVIKSQDFKRKTFKTVLIGQYGAENGVLIQSDKQSKADIIFKGDSTIKMKIASNSHMLKLKIDGKSFNIELDYKEDFQYRFFLFVQNLEVVLKN
ncbi:hypothetical protein pb186bvf_017067 [Paramecium bursaria]